MRVILAQSMGMCFGVRDALAAAERVADPSSTTIYGELVHNETVLRRLGEKGFRTVGESERRDIPQTPGVLITAHGLSSAERGRLEAAGRRIVDTTCPLVARVHEAAGELESEGRFVIVIGRRGHVEVEGIIGDLTRCVVVERPDEVERLPHRRLGVVCQTTAAPADVDAIRRAVEDRNPAADIRFVDTVCQPTRDRQTALDDLLPRVDVMVVIGGRKSNNTRKLVRRCRKARVPAYHVQGPAGLEPEWFAGARAAGLTAGTSTPDSTIRQVHRRLVEIAQDLRSAR